MTVRLTPFFGIMLIAGLCMGQGRPSTTPPVAPAVTEPVKPIVASADNAGLAVDSKTFTLGVEDVIQVIVWGDERFNGVHTIRPDGKISMLLIGDVQAGGLTPDRLRDQLKQAVSELVQRPDVTVKVLQVNSRKFAITGEVSHTGMFPLIKPTRVFDALSLAGGFKDFANTKNILIIRDNGKERFKFNYNQVLKGQHLEQNIFLENGDTIVVK
jgi:polysaccharide export outer membrane protein